MLAALGKMTDANQKEMLAGLFLSKFNTKESKAGLERLGYDTFQDAYKGLAELVGGNPLSVRNYRDEFDPVFPNGRTGYYMRKMHPTRRAMLDAYGSMDLETMAELLEEQFLGTEKFVNALDDALNTSSTGEEVARKADNVGVSDPAHFISGSINPESSAGRERVVQTKKGQGDSVAFPQVDIVDIRRKVLCHRAHSSAAVASEPYFRLERRPSEPDEPIKRIVPFCDISCCV